MRSKDAQVLMAVGSNWLGVNRYVFKRCLNAWTLWHSWTSVGREFQMKGVTTLKTRRVRSVWVWGTTMSSVSDDHKDRVEMQVCTRSLRYASVAVLDTLQVIRVTLYVTCCLAGSQCSDL